jgi:hypothetical protein
VVWPTSWPGQKSRDNKNCRPHELFLLSLRSAERDLTAAYLWTYEPWTCLLTAHPRDATYAELIVASVDTLPSIHGSPSPLFRGFDSRWLQVPGCATQHGISRPPLENNPIWRRSFTHVVAYVEVRGCQRKPVIPDACRGRESKGTLPSILSVPVDP